MLQRFVKVSSVKSLNGKLVSLTLKNDAQKSLLIAELHKPRFETCEWFGDEQPQKFCKKPSQFYFVSFGHYLQFRQKSHQNTME